MKKLIVILAFFLCSTFAFADNTIVVRTYECKAYAHHHLVPQHVNARHFWNPFRKIVNDKEREACIADQSTFVGSNETHNIWLNAGVNNEYCLLFSGSCSQIAYIGLCTDTATPAKSDTGCTTEVTSTRPSCTWAHTSGASTAVCSWSWTNSSGSSQTISTILGAWASTGTASATKALLYAAPTVSNTGVQTGTYTFNLLY
jgi:hypothetical protein